MLTTRFSLVFLVAAMFSSTAVSAQPAVKSSFDERAVADFYRGKTIRILVGSGPGGTYDIYSRLLSKHMPRFVPGNPTLLVQPRPGAGGLIAANALYNSEPKDARSSGRSAKRAESSSRRPAQSVLGYFYGSRV
jgi:tripartite-type tricarboxylate transporter receptor subunit TctC